MALSQADINSMAAEMVGLMSLLVTLKAKQSGGSWSTVASGVPAAISPANETERAKYRDLGYQEPLDGTMRVAFNSAIIPGLQVVVTSVNGSAAGAGEAHVYQILSVDDLLSFGAIMECRLWRVT